MLSDIKHEYFYHHPPRDVWELLTKSEFISQWLMPNDFKPVVGHKFQFKTKAMPQLNSDGVFHCEVLEIVPLRRLSYSWKGGPGDGSINFDTVVTWTLKEKDNGTELQIVHSGFDSRVNRDLYNGLMNGWKEKLENIHKQLNPVLHGAGNS